MKRKITATLISALVLAIICTALLPTSVAMATQYGSADTSNADVFWYYGENFLNIAGMKESVAKWIGNADKSKPVVIGVLDTGVNTTHEVFAKTNTLYKVGDVVQGYNATVASSTKNPTTEQLLDVADKTTNSHGTAVASIMAMMIYELGLQDYIKLYPIKATRGETDVFPRAAVVEGLNFVKDTQDSIGIDVVNLAFCTNDPMEYHVYKDLFLNLSSECVLVAAAGNNKLSSVTNPYYPAVYDGMLSVMGYGRDGVKYNNGNYGPDYDLCAPAVDIYTAKGEADSYVADNKGTSMATAFVSVVAAILTLREQTAESSFNSTVIARHIATSSNKNSIVYYDKSYPRFESYDSVNNEITETYLEPTGISISNDKNITNDTTVHRGQYDGITFTADLLPYANTNPNLDAEIVWTVTEVLTREVFGEDGKPTGSYENYDGQTNSLGKGKSVTYVPNIKGKYRITATYTKGENNFKAETVFNVEYMSYNTVAGIAYVKPLSAPEDSQLGDVSGSVYKGESVTFGLAYMNGVDPSTEITWYVNGNIAGRGAQFNFVGEKSGEYVITAQYGDYRQLEKVYTLEVKSPFYKQSTWIPVTVVLAVLVAVGVGVGIFFGVKKKNG